MRQIYKSDYVLTMDFGGTKLAAAVIDICTGNIIAISRKTTPALLGAGAAFNTMIEIGKDVLKQSELTDQIKRIGISFGGLVDKNRTTVLHSHHVEGWDGLILTKKIASIFNLPTYMDNDVNAAALGEWYFGSGERVNNFVYIQVSTGVGAGLILNNNLYRGEGLAGEFGHMTVMPDGPKCLCGKNGCIESLCSGWAIARDGKAALHTITKDSPLWQLSNGFEDNIDAKMVIDAYRKKDPSAKAILKRAFTNLGIGIANIIGLLDPEIVTIGGGIARAKDVILEFLEPVLEEQVHYIFRDRYRLVFSKFNGEETLLGAALLSNNNDYFNL